MTSSFWFGKRVLVTGANGFVASALVARLVKEGAIVTALIRHRSPVAMALQIDREGLLDSIDIEYSDLLDFAQLRRIYDRHLIDTIFHLAASAIVSDAANSPLSTAENNIIPTLNILELARVNGCSRTIIASTDKVYGDHVGDVAEPLPYRESYAIRGLDVYSASKACTDLLAQTYVFQYKLPVALTRSSNIYGPGDLNFTRLIPRTIMRLLAGRSPVINLGNDHVLREYIHVEDVCSAYLLLGERLADWYGPQGENLRAQGAGLLGWPAFNIGSYDSKELEHWRQLSAIRSVRGVIEAITTKIGGLEPSTIPKPANFVEIPDQYADASKLLSLGFRPQWEFDAGIDATIKWYRKHHETLRSFAHRYVAI